MIKERKTIIKSIDGEKTCLSCVNQINGYCCCFDGYLASIKVSGCIDYVHYKELKEVK